MKSQQAYCRVNVMDTQVATEALYRAAEMARKTAMDTDTCVVVMENGSVVYIRAEQLREQQKVR